MVDFYRVEHEGSWKCIKVISENLSFTLSHLQIVLGVNYLFIGHCSAQSIHPVNVDFSVEKDSVIWGFLQYNNNVIFALI